MADELVNPIGDIDMLSKAVVQSLLENFDCQPVLFVGSGLARRYLEAPDWEGALRYLLDKLPDIKPTYEYLSQKFKADKVKIGSEISDLIFEWAWTSGKDQFSDDLYHSSSKSIFTKHLLAEHLRTITPIDIFGATDTYGVEITALSSIRPHAFITTNYDNMLEGLFPGYEPIIGKRVLRYNLNAYGEVYHIHGSVDLPDTMVFDDDDYREWSEDSKYFAAKLLTYFVEHPVFIFGYSLGDSNVNTVLQDIGKIVADETGLIGNVIQVVFDDKATKAGTQSEYAVPVNGSQYRIRVLTTSSLLDVFEALTARHELKQVNPAMIRALAARAMKLTRHDIPNGDIIVNYQTLEGILESDDALPTLLGITQADDINKGHPYILSVVGEKLGYPGWNGANRLLERIKAETGVDLKASDNVYHCAVKTGKKDSSITRKYSMAAVKLLEQVKNDQNYKLEI